MFQINLSMLRVQLLRFSTSPTVANYIQPAASSSTSEVFSKYSPSEDAEKMATVMLVGPPKKC